MSEVMIMNSRAITRNAMTDIEVMAATRKNEEELRELAIAAEKISRRGLIMVTQQLRRNNADIIAGRRKMQRVIL